MTTAEKSEAILKKIIEIINTGETVAFETDMYNWTATIMKGELHTHVGIPGKDGSFDLLVNNLYDLLINGQGLSWNG